MQIESMGRYVTPLGCRVEECVRVNKPRAKLGRSHVVTLQMERCDALQNTPSPSGLAWVQPCTLTAGHSGPHQF